MIRLIFSVIMLISLVVGGTTGATDVEDMKDVYAAVETARLDGEQASSLMAEASGNTGDGNGEAALAQHEAKRAADDEYQDISHGNSGDNVVRLQERLAELGYYAGRINGKYDTETQKAVKRFQKDNGLGVDRTATGAFQAFLYSEEAQAAP